jgi:hypothetical protein
MHRKEVNDRSPLRLLESSIHGGLGRGNLGVVVARHGVGKSAFLVDIALDDLMRGRNVLHVSLEHTVSRVCDYYDEIFAELAHTQHLDDPWRVRLDIERHRRIHSQLDGAFKPVKLEEAVRFMREYGEFVPAAIILDGLDFDSIDGGMLSELRRIARETDAELWMSAVMRRDAQRNARGIPEPVARFEQQLDVILVMAHDGTAVHVSLHKDHDNPEITELKLALDPTTMLIVQE